MLRSPPASRWTSVWEPSSSSTRISVAPYGNAMPAEPWTSQLNARRRPARSSPWVPCAGRGCAGRRAAHARHGCPGAARTRGSAIPRRPSAARTPVRRRPARRPARAGTPTPRRCSPRQPPLPRGAHVIGVEIAAAAGRREHGVAITAGVGGDEAARGVVPQVDVEGNRARSDRQALGDASAPDHQEPRARGRVEAAPGEDAVRRAQLGRRGLDGDERVGRRAGRPPAGDDQGCGGRRRLLIAAA